MKITSDWHIHTHNSFDNASLTLTKLIERAPGRGIKHFGITDHVNSSLHYKNIIASRREFDEVDPGPHVHFGVELSCMSQWELDLINSGEYQQAHTGIRIGGKPNCTLALPLSHQHKKEFKIEYVIAGVHWPMYSKHTVNNLIQDYHRQYLFLANHPLVDIIAHPWWWFELWIDENGNRIAGPWMDSFDIIPDTVHNEFAEAVVKNNKYVEINCNAVFLSKRLPENYKLAYIRYIDLLQNLGVKFSIGSDCHDSNYDTNFEKVESYLNKCSLNEKDLFLLPPRK